MKYFLMLISILTLMSACESVNKAEISSESTDKKAKIAISGQRQSNLDPFQTSIIIEGYGQSDTLVAEIFAGNLTNETVNFDWTDDKNCRITFIQQDDSKKKIIIGFNEDGNSLKTEE